MIINPDGSNYYTSIEGLISRINSQIKKIEDFLASIFSK